jgi:hypothetical protein
MHWAVVQPDAVLEKPARDVEADVALEPARLSSIIASADLNVNRVPQTKRAEGDPLPGLGNRSKEQRPMFNDRISRVEI